MSCRVCEHTIQRISPEYFWCPRCGCLVAPHGVPDHEAPMLVERVRRVIKRLESPDVSDIGGDPIDLVLEVLKETIGAK